MLFCLVGGAYHRRLNPEGRRYEALKRLSDSGVLTLALFQQLRGVESCRSFPRDAGRFLARLFPGVVGLWPSWLRRRLLRLRRCFLEPLRRAVVPELVGDPQTLIVDPALLPVLHPRQVGQSAGSEGAAWARWGSFSVYGVELRLLCATNRAPVSYELTPANAAGVLLAREPLAEAGPPEGGAARRSLGDLAYRSAASRGRSWPGARGAAGDRAGRAEASRQAARRGLLREPQARRLGPRGDAPAETLVGPATRIAAKMAACTYALYVNRL